MEYEILPKNCIGFSIQILCSKFLFDAIFRTSSIKRGIQNKLLMPFFMTRKIRKNIPIPAASLDKKCNKDFFS
jgi:hypothetical protein